MEERNDHALPPPKGNNPPPPPVQTMRDYVMPPVDRCIVETQVFIDVACGGTLVKKSPREAYELIELLALNHYQTTSDKEQKRGILEIRTLDAMLAQN
ncbi:hypothetical protein L6164_013358 [Bauhinia variegata]|uniref:Uncharacterized protein n=1 Tax=Bauhinia variegata TaxID=167791 RepID=A0ACB9NEG4_BAUVA|nr:hypothetical protein L6164_013358 [Bauhinia variegata]